MQANPNPLANHLVKESQGASSEAQDLRLKLALIMNRLLSQCSCLEPESPEEHQLKQQIAVVQLMNNQLEIQRIKTELSQVCAQNDRNRVAHS